MEELRLVAWVTDNIGDNAGDELTLLVFVWALLQNCISFTNSTRISKSSVPFCKF
jgi:hypothetical protein